MKSEIIGKPVDRKDGRLKVTGQATYGAEHQIEGVVHAYLVTSKISKGAIKSIDTSAAERAPGVVAIITRATMPPLFHPVNNWQDNALYEKRMPFSDDRIHYAGQIVAVAVADTFERARHAASLVSVDYTVEKFALGIDDAPAVGMTSAFGAESEFKKGDADGALASAAVKIDDVYSTTVETHNPMEPHAIIAHWEGDRLTVYEPSQWVMGSRSAYSQAFGLAEERVRIVSPFVGGGFGCKALPWPHGFVAIAAAKVVGRPVKLVLHRRQMFSNAGHRPQTRQALAVGTDRAGKIVAIRHEVVNHTSTVDSYTEEASGVAKFVYASPAVRASQKLVEVNVGTPTFMRAPGENPGLWALETAMDELAYELKTDPVALRVLNHSDAHGEKNLPFSSKHLRECYEIGARKFGWSGRTAAPRSMAKDGLQVGWGMASSTFPGIRLPARAKARLMADGTAIVYSATHELGTGAYTVFAQTAAHALGLPIEKVRFELGESSMPSAPVAGGSMSTASVAPAILAACQAVMKKAGELAVGDKASPVAGAKPPDLIMEGPRISLKSDPSKYETVFDMLKRRGMASVDAEAGAGPGDEGTRFAFQSWGAHFCEVTVDEEIARARVTRWVAVMDIGTVMNAKTAASQVRGGVVMGIGQALMEETLYDPKTARPIVYDLATYHIPAHADIPHIDVEFVDQPDENFNPLGCRGVGEIGITGVSAAIGNAIFHATGKRLRSLPITPDALL